MDDLISRQEALEKVRTMQTYKLFMGDDMILIDKAEVQKELMMLPPAQPAHAIPVEWIEGQIERLNNTDNYFAELTANIIKTMLNEWRKGEQK